MKFLKLGALAFVLFTPLSYSAETPIESKAQFKREASHPATVYATVLPKGNYFKLVSVQLDGGAGATLVSNANLGTEFTWGLTNDRVHFMLFGEVLNVSLIAPTSTVVTKTLSDKDITVAKGGFGVGLHPTKTRDFFGVLFCSFDQTLFTNGSATDTNRIDITRLTIPHVGVKLSFLTLRWGFLSLGAEVNGAVALSASNSEQSMNWGYNTFGKIIIGFELNEKLGLELDPEFGYSKYYTHVASQSRTESGVAVGLKLSLD